MDIEIWKSIRDWPFYEVSNKGRVRSIDKPHPRTGKPMRGRILTPGRCMKYLNVCFKCSTKKIKKTFYVHRLVAEHFVPNPLKKREVNHEDGNTHNNHMSNLSWVTKLENEDHATKMNLRTNSERKLDWKKVNQIRALRGIIPYREIAEMYNVSHRHISAIMGNEVWKD